MQISAKKRSFDDPGVLRLKESAWTTWHLYAPQFHQGNLTKTRGAARPRVQADPVELAKALAELGG